MKAIHKTYQIVLAFSKAVSRYLFKSDIIKIFILSPLLCYFNRSGMIIETIELRIRVILSHNNGGCTVSASDIGYPTANPETLTKPVERRKPIVNKILTIARPEERFCSKKQIMIMLMPAKSLAVFEGISKF